MYQKTSQKRTVLLIVVLGFVFLIFAPVINAEPLAPVFGEFAAVFEGIDPNTGELIFEGFRTGEISGELSARVLLTKQTGVALHLLTRWTVTTPWGEIIRGENTALLNTASFHFREHGVIVEATGSLAELIGNFIVVHGQFSDLDFIPGVTEVTAQAIYVPAQAN